MNTTSKFGTLLAISTCGLLISGCGGSDDSAGPLPIAQPPAPVAVPYTNGATTPANPVAYWNKIAVDTINVPPTPGTGTPEEQRPSFSVDLATVHTAIYDAVISITETHSPFAVTPTSSAPDASQEAAVAAAAYGVLKGLFPNRFAQYQAAYDSYVAALPASSVEIAFAKNKGLEIGAEVANKTLALRANDGRMTDVPYTPGTAPGKFRGVNPVGTFNASVKPFTLTSASQFRLPPPPALDSAAYAADFEEVRAWGGMVSTQRTADQLEAARAHSESPATYPTRNYRQFAMDSRSLADNARLMAMMWVAQADAGIACFETKYFYLAWRPLSAIPLADTDGNSATAPDAAWVPVIPTPNHPEYPSAHMCANSANTAVLKSFFGTNQISYSFGSTVTGGVRQYATPDAMLAEITQARVSGGMHFRNSNVQGGVLGTNVANWVLANHFKPRS